MCELLDFLPSLHLIWPHSKSPFLILFLDFDLQHSPWPNLCYVYGSLKTPKTQWDITATIGFAQIRIDPKRRSA